MRKGDRELLAYLYRQERWQLGVLRIISHMNPIHRHDGSTIRPESCLASLSPTEMGNLVR
jgi:hypothetical protein